MLLVYGNLVVLAIAIVIFLIILVDVLGSMFYQYVLGFYAIVWVPVMFAVANTVLLVVLGHRDYALLGALPLAIPGSAYAYIRFKDWLAFIEYNSVIKVSKPIIVKILRRNKINANENNVGLVLYKQAKEKRVNIRIRVDTGKSDLKRVREEIQLELSQCKGISKRNMVILFG